MRRPWRNLARRDVYGLSEVMNYPGVLGGDPEVLAKIEAARRLGKPVDGHAPGLRGAQARAYAAAGITTDHECYTLAGGARKNRRRRFLREGSGARNLDDDLLLLRERPEACMFCCDDLHPDLPVRHIDELVRGGALAAGADRLDTLLREPAPRAALRAEGRPAPAGRSGGLHRLRGLENAAGAAHLPRRETRGARRRLLLPRHAPKIVNAFKAGARRPEAAWRRSRAGST